jgi:hypothetical protein
MNPYNVAIVLIRVSALITILLGTLGLLFVGSFVSIYLLGAPEWFSQIVAPYAVQSVVASPIWIIGGCVVFGFSRRLARFIAKACDSEETKS